MILICTDADLEVGLVPLSEVGGLSLNYDAQLAATHAEDVYFWRAGEVKPLKRRNAPLVVPEWMKNLEGVDR